MLCLISASPFDEQKISVRRCGAVKFSPHRPMKGLTASLDCADPSSPRHGVCRADGKDVDPQSIIKHFTPEGGATWLITKAGLSDPDHIFSLSYRGLGGPQLDCVNRALRMLVEGVLRLKTG